MKDRTGSCEQSFSAESVTSNSPEKGDILI